MAKQPPTNPTSDDGTWFLEAVGATPPTPTSLQAVEELSRDNDVAADDEIGDRAKGREPAEVVVASFDGDPGTSTSTFHPVPKPPPPPPVIAPGARPPAPPPTVHDPPAAEDATLAPELRTRRPFRWSVVLFVGALVGALALTVFLIPRALTESTLTIRQENYDATLAVRTYLPTAQGALGTITDPASDGDALAAAVPEISGLSSHASRLAQAATIPIPTAPPLIDRTPFEEIATLTERSNILAADASQIALRIGHAYVYRTSVPLLLDTGDLPTEATTQGINTLAIDLAASLADDTTVLSDLPDDPAFASVADTARSSLERYRSWQDEYLAALAEGDADAAAVLVEEISTVRTGLAAANLEALLAFRTEMDGRIISLADQLDAHLTALEG